MPLILNFLENEVPLQVLYENRAKISRAPFLLLTASKLEINL